MTNAYAELVAIPVDGVHIEGMLELPPDARGVVLFAHGSGSSRHSPRNTFVARHLQTRRLGTLLIDLLTPAEDRHYQTRFDISLLTHRLATATAWLGAHPATRLLPLGYFGASTGAAAALQAAGTGARVGAVVSRGGRPDLADPDALARVTAPTLLLVGGRDDVVIELNREALGLLRCQKELSIVPGATHLFEEPGTLEVVARQAGDWFIRHLAATAS